MAENPDVPERLILRSQTTLEPLPFRLLVKKAVPWPTDNEVNAREVVAVEFDRYATINVNQNTHEWASDYILVVLSTKGAVVGRIPKHLEEAECKHYSDCLFKSLADEVPWLQPEDILPWLPDPNEVPYREAPVVMMFFSPEAPEQEPTFVTVHFRHELSMWELYATDNIEMLRSYKTGPGQQSKLTVEFSKDHPLPIVKTLNEFGEMDQVQITLPQDLLASV